MKRTLFLVALAACLPARAIPPTSEASCKAACVNLEALRCPEGEPSGTGISCLDVCERMVEIRRVDLSCVASAKDKTAVRACGFVRCE